MCGEEKEKRGRQRVFVGARGRGVVFVSVHSVPFCFVFFQLPYASWVQKYAQLQVFPMRSMLNFLQVEYVFRLFL